MSDHEQGLDHTSSDASWSEVGSDKAGAGDVLDRAHSAALRLAQDRPWSEISLRDIARAADIAFAELYVLASSKAVLMDKLSRKSDQAALAAIDGADSADVGDRLFEAVMARLDVLQPHRAAYIAIAQAEGGFAIAPRLPRTARSLLEAAGVDTDGSRGALRIGAMTGVWVRVLQVWRDDEGALNRTMAEIDKRLKLMAKRLKQVGVGL